MNLVLLLPAGLAALAALALPLLIHLARRQQERPTVFAALRWLRAKPRPRRRVRFDEWPLLLVRLLLVALVALLLAQPALLGVKDARTRLLVVPGVDEAAIREADTRAGDDVDARWLAPGFPGLDQPAPAAPSATASLLREFDAALPPAAPLTVLVPDTLDGADAARLRLSREVDWQVVAASSPASAVVRIAPPVLAIRHDPAHRDGVRFLHAAALAWQADGAAETANADRAASEGPSAAGTGADDEWLARGTVDVSGDTDADLPADAEVLAWLRAGQLPAEVLDWVERGGQLLLAADATPPASAAASAIWRDADGAPLLDASAYGAGRVLQFARPLQPAAMPALVEPTFASRLRDLLQPPAAPTRVAAQDYAPDTGAEAVPAPARLLHPWWALAIALVALLERWMATSRYRRVLA